MAFEISALEDGALEIGRVKAGARKIGPLEVDEREVGSHKEGPHCERIAQIHMTQTRRRYLPKLNRELRRLIPPGPVIGFHRDFFVHEAKGRSIAHAIEGIGHPCRAAS